MEITTTVREWLNREDKAGVTKVVFTDTPRSFWHNDVTGFSVSGEIFTSEEAILDDAFSLGLADENQAIYLAMFRSEFPGVAFEMPEIPGLRSGLGPVDAVNIVNYMAAREKHRCR